MEGCVVGALFAAPTLRPCIVILSFCHFCEKEVVRN